MLAVCSSRVRRKFPYLVIFWIYLIFTKPVWSLIFEFSHFKLRLIWREIFLCLLQRLVWGFFGHIVYSLLSFYIAWWWLCDVETNVRLGDQFSVLWWFKFLKWAVLWTVWLVVQSICFGVCFVLSFDVRFWVEFYVQLLRGCTWYHWCFLWSKLWDPWLLLSNKFFITQRVQLTLLLDFNLFLFRFLLCLMLRVGFLGCKNFFSTFLQQLSPQSSWICLRNLRWSIRCTFLLFFFTTFLLSKSVDLLKVCKLLKG